MQENFKFRHLQNYWKFTIFSNPILKRKIACKKNPVSPDCGRENVRYLTRRHIRHGCQVHTPDRRITFHNNQSRRAAAGRAKLLARRGRTGRAQLQAVVSGTGSNFGTIEHTQIDYKEAFNKKEIIAYTSGLGGLFKPGIPIGKIDNSSKGQINFFSDFTQLDYVKIVSYKFGGDK